MSFTLIRALNHFNLINYFRAVPLKVTPTVGVNDLSVGCTPVHLAYNQTITDLEYAAERIPANTSLKDHTLFKYAAIAILARVCLQKKIMKYSFDYI